MLTKTVDWLPYLPQGLDKEKLYQIFKEKAEAVPVKVIRAKDKAEAEDSIVQEMKRQHCPGNEGCRNKKCGRSSYGSGGY